MCQRIDVKGYDGLMAKIKELDTTKQVYIYFTGEKNNNGRSWCSDCTEAEPEVLKAVEEHTEPNSTLLWVDVGNRAFWKDMCNPFRSHPDLRIQVIPTIIRWKSVERLDGDLCKKSSLLELFFTDE